jgi:hypothetical protein
VSSSSPHALLRSAGRAVPASVRFESARITDILQSPKGVLMDYIFFITLKTKNISGAHQCIKDAIAFIQEDLNTTVTAYAVPSTFNYIALMGLPNEEAAIKVATDLSIGGDASVSTSLAASMDAYGAIIETRGNKKGT